MHTSVAGRSVVSGFLYQAIPPTESVGSSGSVVRARRTKRVPGQVEKTPRRAKGPRGCQESMGVAELCHRPHGHHNGLRATNQTAKRHGRGVGEWWSGQSVGALTAGVGVALSGATAATFGNRAPGSGERLGLHYVSLYRSAPRGVHCSYWARRACVLFSLLRRRRRLLLLLLTSVPWPAHRRYRFLTSTTTSAEPRCSSASNNHSIRACGKSTCWLPLNESERARARTPLCHRRRTIKSRSSRECTVTIGPHSIRIGRLPVPRRTSWTANCDNADLGISDFGQSVPPIKPRPVWCTIEA